MCSNGDGNPASECDVKVGKTDRAILLTLGYLLVASLIILSILSYVVKAKICSAVWNIIMALQFVRIVSLFDVYQSPHFIYFC